MVDPPTLAALQIFQEERHASQMGIGKSKEGFSVYGVMQKCITQMVRGDQHTIAHMCMWLFVSVHVGECVYLRVYVMHGVCQLLDPSQQTNKQTPSGLHESDGAWRTRTSPSYLAIVSS